MPGKAEVCQPAGIARAPALLSEGQIATLRLDIAAGIRDQTDGAEMVAAGMYALAYKIGIKNLPEGLSAREFVRAQLDRLEIGQELERFPWGSKRPTLPPSKLKQLDSG